MSSELSFWRQKNFKIRTFPNSANNWVTKISEMVSSSVKIWHVVLPYVIQFWPWGQFLTSECRKTWIVNILRTFLQNTIFLSTWKQVVNIKLVIETVSVPIISSSSSCAVFGYFFGTTQPPKKARVLVFYFYSFW